MTPHMRIGIDLGGTKIEGIVLDRQGEVRARSRVATPRGDYDATLAAIATLVTQLEREAGCSPDATVGLGMPGTISSATGLVKNANSVWLNGRPFDADVQRALGRPVRFSNDANCFALSEATDGAARGARVVFGVIIGTGTGGGFVVDGRAIDGRNGIAGEWGHNALPWPMPEELPGPSCYCGRSGCIETFLSGPGLAKDFLERPVFPAEAGSDTASAVPSGLSRMGVAAEQVVSRAVVGDPAAEAALARYEHRMARALASVINVLDPDAIVLGGGLSNIDRLYTDVPALWGQWVFSDRVDTPLLKAAHGDSSGVRGAARLW
jgi:fructokinase